MIADVPADATLFGTPARPHREFLRAQVAMFRLSKIVGELEQLVESKTAPPAAPEAPPAATEP
jgi:UDP-3-O-[3-hydroxymyristoyl] glucosamine N-acyltransferase